jgi:hypothetical protein
VRQAFSRISVNDFHAVYRVDANGRFILPRLLQYGEIVK